jgi:hypothetical protein
LQSAWLTDGQAKGVYRTAELGVGLKTIGRKDVAQFITEDVLPNCIRRNGNAICVGY